MRAKRLRVVIPAALVALLAVFALVGALVRSGDQSESASIAQRELAPGAADDGGTSA